MGDGARGQGYKVRMWSVALGYVEEGQRGTATR